MVRSTIFSFCSVHINAKQYIAVDKSRHHREYKLRERRESNPGPLGVKQERFPLCYAAPQELFVCLFKLAKLGRISEVGRMGKKLGTALHRGTVRSSHQAVPGSNLKTLKEQKDDDK